MDQFTGPTFSICLEGFKLSVFSIVLVQYFCLVSSELSATLIIALILLVFLSAEEQFIW